MGTGKYAFISGVITREGQPVEGAEIGMSADVADGCQATAEPRYTPLTQVVTDVAGTFGGTVALFEPGDDPVEACVRIELLHPTDTTLVTPALRFILDVEDPDTFQVDIELPTESGD